MLKALNFFRKIIEKEESSVPLLYEPLWYNPLIGLPYIKTWDNKRLRIVRDLISEEAQIKTMDEITNDFGISLNFLNYARLIKSLPSNWTTCSYAWYLSETTPWCQTFCSLILNDNRISQVIKREFQKSNVSIPPAISAWKKDLTITDSLIPSEDLGPQYTLKCKDKVFLTLADHIFLHQCTTLYCCYP